MLITQDKKIHKIHALAVLSIENNTVEEKYCNPMVTIGILNKEQLKTWVQGKKFNNAVLQKSFKQVSKYINSDKIDGFLPNHASHLAKGATERTQALNGIFASGMLHDKVNEVYVAAAFPLYNGFITACFQGDAEIGQASLQFPLPMALLVAVLFTPIVIILSLLSLVFALPITLYHQHKVLLKRKKEAESNNESVTCYPLLYIGCMILAILFCPVIMIIHALRLLFAYMFLPIINTMYLVDYFQFRAALKENCYSNDLMLFHLCKEDIGKKFLQEKSFRSFDDSINAIESLKDDEQFKATANKVLGSKYSDDVFNQYFDILKQAKNGTLEIEEKKQETAIDSSYVHPGWDQKPEISKI